MGNLQNNIKGQITRSLSNESDQATDNVSSRQTAPAEQSQQSSPDTQFQRCVTSHQRPRSKDGSDSIRGRSDQSLGSDADFDKVREDYPESLDAWKRAVSVLRDAAHDTPQDLMQLQTLMLVPSEARDQLAQSVQHREEPMVLELAVHTLNSHGVQEMKKQMVVKRACSRREMDAVAGTESDRVHQANQDTVGYRSVQTELADRGDVCDTTHSCER